MGSRFQIKFGMTRFVSFHHPKTQAVILNLIQDLLVGRGLA